MILDLERFVREGEPRWQALEATLGRMEKHPYATVAVAELERLHALYQRTSADLLRVRGLHTEARMRQYLESLVSRGYTAIHGVTERKKASWHGCWSRSASRSTRTPSSWSSPTTPRIPRPTRCPPHERAHPDCELQRLLR